MVRPDEDQESRGTEAGRVLTRRSGLSRHLTPPSPGRWGPVLLLLLSAAAVSACARGLPYARIDRALQDGNPAEGVAILEKAQDAYGSKSTALYLMDRGMVQYVAGRYTDSVQSLSAAEALTEDLYTRRIRSEVEAFLTSDNALPYEGEEFEKVLLNVFMALDYVQLGLWDDALVEARKVDHKLTVLADRNQKRMTYNKDALARYLSGLLYEATGDRSNAFVAYRLALEAFEYYQKSYGTAVPDLVRQDLLRVTEALGLNQEHQEYQRAFPGLMWQSEAAARAAWKYALAEAVRVGVRESFGDKNTGAVAGAVAGAIARSLAIASEEADKRSWATLPDRVFVGRMRLPPGTYDVELRHIGAYGGVVATQMLKGVTITERDKRFVSTRVLQ